MGITPSSFRTPPQSPRQHPTQPPPVQRFRQADYVDPPGERQANRALFVADEQQQEEQQDMYHTPPRRRPIPNSPPPVRRTRPIVQQEGLPQLMPNSPDSIEEQGQTGEAAAAVLDESPPPIRRYFSPDYLRAMFAPSPPSSPEPG